MLANQVKAGLRPIAETLKMRRPLGPHVVADPQICHGQPTFRGTRILVSDVLEQVARGMAWDVIIENWRGAITKEGIAEAVRLARASLLNHADELATGPTKG